MRFEKHDLSDGMKIPVAALNLGGFGMHEAAEYHVLKDAIVVLKKQMSAAELSHAVWSLQQLSGELLTHLTDQCCPCDGCADIGYEGDHCPVYEVSDFAVELDIPEELRERSGIPKDVPIRVKSLNDGEITFCVNRGKPGLWDVPAPVMRGFLAAGFCPAGLEDVLETGEIIYGT